MVGKEKPRLVARHHPRRPRHLPRHTRPLEAVGMVPHEARESLRHVTLEGKALRVSSDGFQKRPPVHPDVLRREASRAQATRAAKRPARPGRRGSPAARIRPRFYSISAPCAQGRSAPLMLRWPSAPEVNSGASHPTRVRTRPFSRASEKRGLCAQRRSAPSPATTATLWFRTPPARTRARRA